MTAARRAELVKLLAQVICRLDAAVHEGEAAAQREQPDAKCAYLAGWLESECKHSAQDLLGILKILEGAPKRRSSHRANPLGHGAANALGASSGSDGDAK